MQLRWLSLLGLQQSIYNVPISSRFDSYLNIMMNGDAVVETKQCTKDDDPKYPLLSNMNPMAKTDKLLPMLERLLENQAEYVGQQVIDTFNKQSPFCSKNAQYSDERDNDNEDCWNVAFVVVDDAGGGWTSHADVLYKHMFENRYLLDRNWIDVLLWTSSLPQSKAEIQIAVETCVHRTVYQINNDNGSDANHMACSPLNKESGTKKRKSRITLGEMLDQEAWVWNQVETTTTTTTTTKKDNKKIWGDDEEINKEMNILLEYSCATDYPTQIAALFGDDVAVSLGHPPLSIGDKWTGLNLCRYGQWDQ